MTRLTWKTWLQWNPPDYYATNVGLTSVDLCTHHPNKHAEPTMLWGEVPKAAVLCVRNGLKKKEKMCAERIELKLLEKIQDPFSEKSRVLSISPREDLWILMIH